MEQLLRRWWQLGVWLPTAFVLLVAAASIFAAGRVLSDVAVVLLITALTALGAAVFSSVAFRVLGRAQRETARKARELAAVNEASLALSSELDLASVLQRVVQLSREVTNARYGALAMLDEEGGIAEFLTSGLTEEERRRIGPTPQGKGLLGLVLREGQALRVDRISAHPNSSGFPPNHPPMTSFIGLPIVFEGRIVGDLYLTDKNGGEPFTREDEGTLRTFAAHAAIAIENARLYRQVQDLAVLEERDRIGMDLHDGIIQSLYATGLHLEVCLEDLKNGSSQAQGQVRKAIDELNQTIADIRSYIFNLRPSALAGTDLVGAVGALLQELKVNALIDVALTEEPGACGGLTEEQSISLYHIAQEALTNTRKHARASRVDARFEREGDLLLLMTITDDGAGFDAARPSTGHGLRNMYERTEALGGRLEILSSATGTIVRVALPVEREETHERPAYSRYDR